MQKHSFTHHAIRKPPTAKPRTDSPRPGQWDGVDFEALLIRLASSARTRTGRLIITPDQLVAVYRRELQRAKGTK